MPDWSYRTVFRPLLFSLSAETARELALGAMGRLSRLPLGPTVIDLFGHMRPDSRLRQSVLGLTIPSPVGIGHTVDPHGLATEALARFGIGFIEIGPIAIRKLQAAKPIEQRVASEAIWVPPEPIADSVEEWTKRLSHRKKGSTLYLARLICAVGTPADQATTECRKMQEGLARTVDGIVLATSDEAMRAHWSSDDWQRHVEGVVEASRTFQRNDCVWVAIRADLNPDQLSAMIGQALVAGCRGVVVEGRLTDPTGGWIVGRESFGLVDATVQCLRSEFGNEFSLIAGGVHEPVDAIALRRHGADCVVVDSGLIYSGPGLPKRINEAVLFADRYQQRPEAVPRPIGSDRPTIPLPKLTWFWTFILGTALLLGGLLAFGIASTRVILPYDEVFVGMSRYELNLINPRLLAFMQHDRVTLSGTMISLAVLYLCLSWYGIRRGAHWAKVAVLVSSFVGFASFFLFLGFGYFDPFHAFVTAINFQFVLMAFQGEISEAELTTCPNLRETPEWRWGQWGQLAFVIHGVVLVCAGAIISGVGCSTVFVQEDLVFMDVCPSDLTLANPRLVPLIAHDRASFGGMLISIGIAVLLTSLWGFREGARWQWWMLLLAGVPAYAIAIGVHLAVGYTSWWHLAPAYGGALVLIAGLFLLWPCMGRRNPALNTEWDRLSGAAAAGPH